MNSDAAVKKNEHGELPAKPKPPAPNECCGRGCVPCIWDYYHRALEKWQAKIDLARRIKAEGTKQEGL